MNLAELSIQFTGAAALFAAFNALVAVGGMDAERTRAIALVPFGLAFVLIGLSLLAIALGNDLAASLALLAAFPAALLGEHRWRIAQGLPGYRNRP